MADERNDELTDRQRAAGRRGEVIPGKGFDGGGGYGGAGNDNAYDRDQNYGAGESAGAELDALRDEGSAFDAGEGGFDRDSPLGGERREPGR